MNKESKMQEFGKLAVGDKFYLGKPETLPATAFYTKIATQKDQNGAWYNAKSAFGIPSFIQYDKRVWITT